MQTASGRRKTGGATAGALRIAFAIAAVGLVLTPAIARPVECDYDNIVLPPGARDGKTWPLYYVDDCVLIFGWCEEHFASFWVYAESNGEPGLQRADAWCYDVGPNGPYTPETADSLAF